MFGTAWGRELGRWAALLALASLMLGCGTLAGHDEPGPAAGPGAAPAAPAGGDAAAPDAGDSAAPAAGAGDAKPAADDAGAEAKAAKADKAPAAEDHHVIAPGLKWGASVRMRYEAKDDFAFGAKSKANDDDYLLTRVRLSLEWSPNDMLTFFVEGQDAHEFGSDVLDKDGVPNVFSDKVDIHQAYVDIKLATGQEDWPVRIRTGRQKFNFGALRVLSTLEWVNTARVYDGVRVTLGTPKKRTLDAFASHVVTPNDNELDHWEDSRSRHFSSALFGVYYSDKASVENAKLDAYWLMRYEEDRDDATQTFGVRAEYKKSGFDAETELAIQFGEYGGMDHLAYMAIVGAGYTFAELNKLRIGVGYEFASGDDDPTDGKHGTFDGLYGLHHKYYGHMDLFVIQNIHSVNAAVSVNLVKNLGLRVAYHAFWLANTNDNWYRATLAPVRPVATGSADPYLGSEIDVTLSFKALDGMIGLTAGYSHLFTGDYISDTGPSEDADFFYLQALFKF